MQLYHEFILRTEREIESVLGFWSIYSLWTTTINLFKRNSMYRTRTESETESVLEFLSSSFFWVTLWIWSGEIQCNTRGHRGNPSRCSRRLIGELSHCSSLRYYLTLFKGSSFRLVNRGECTIQGLNHLLSLIGRHPTSIRRKRERIARAKP